MRIILLIIQALLAVHTLIGAIWKFSNSAAQTMPTLATIPNNLWLVMSIMEILAAIILMVSIFYKPLLKYVSLSALFIILEMLIFSGIHLYSEINDFGPMIYWLVTAVISGFVLMGYKNKSLAHS